jgi:hypothetical protein
MNKLERLLTAGGVSSGLNARALKHVLRYVTTIEARTRMCRKLRCWESW